MPGKKSIAAARRGNFAIARARLLINGLQDLFEDAVERRDWDQVFLLPNSERRVPLLKALWPALKPEEWPSAIAVAISCGDMPSQCLPFLYKALSAVSHRHLRVFDGPDAAERFAALPDDVVVYRGTVQAEIDSRCLGVCWTLSRERAVFFATQHGRFRNLHSPPVLLTAHVLRDRIVGLLVARNEDEVLVVPPVLRTTNPCTTNPLADLQHITITAA